MSQIAGLQDSRGQGPPGDIGVFQGTTSIVVYQFTFSGVTYYVAQRMGVRGWTLAGQGTVFPTVMNAVIADNTSICLRYGVYAQSNEITISGKTNVHIFSEEGAKLVKTGNTKGIHIFSSDNISINGLELYEASTDVWIERNVISACFSGIDVICDYGASHTKSYRVHVNNNEIYGFTCSGITFLNGCEGCEAIGNTIHDGVSHDGVLLYGISTETIGSKDTTSPMVEWLTISYNLIYNLDKHNAIDMHGGNNVTISYNQIHNVGDVAIYAHRPTAAGASVPTCYDWDISHNIIDKCVGGIYIENDMAVSSVVEGVTISNNEINEFTNHGIYGLVGNFASVIMRDVTIDHNIIKNSLGTYIFADGIDFQPGVSSGLCENVIIDSNMIIGTTVGVNPLNNGIIVFYTAKAKITNNIVRGITGHEAVYLVWNCNDATIIGNTISDGAIGIQLLDGDDIMVQGNRINTTTGIDLDSALVVRPMITNNNFKGTTTEINDHGATTPRKTLNIDRNGAWLAGDVNNKLFIPFTDGTTFLSAAGAAWGWEIDAAGEYAIGYIRLPDYVQHTLTLKIVGNSVIAEADGMRLLVTANGGAPNEVYNTENVAVTKTSTTLNFAATDFVEWDILPADDPDVDDFTGGDWIMIKVEHAVAAGGDCETDCIFQGVEVYYL
jgi:parallel beta-helix repeat protein